MLTVHEIHNSKTEAPLNFPLRRIKRNACVRFLINKTNDQKQGANRNASTTEVTEQTKPVKNAFSLMMDKKKTAFRTYKCIEQKA